MILRENLEAKSPGQKSPGDSSHVHVPPYLLDKGFAKVFQKSKII